MKNKKTIVNNNLSSDFAVFVETESIINSFNFHLVIEID